MSKKIKRIAFHTLGCKLNYSETSKISRDFSDEEFVNVGFSEVADYYVINSCSVTNKAEKKCKALIRQALKKNPNAGVAVIGCFSQINPNALFDIQGVKLVLGNSEKYNLFEHIKKLESGIIDENEKASSYNELNDFVPTYSLEGRTRSFFKIQDGCDYFCAYCTIPLARGKSRSNTVAETINFARELSKTNIKEIVLTGVNIGDFGKLHGESFYDLLKELVNIDSLERIRISSIEPDLLNDEIIELVAKNNNLMPHFHIPLQSGCDEVLKDMGRRYDTALFTSRIEKIRSLIPHACIAVDLIVGFPSESDELFEKSFNFIEQADVSYVHVFTYSERDNTRAVRLQASVPNAERNIRSKRMHELSEKKLKEFYEKNIGMKAKVLWEKENSDGFMFGFTDNYIKVKTRYNEKLVNQITDVVLNEMEGGEFGV